ncbi:MAG: type I pantothenate kinase, partial [Methylocella sp.]
MDVRVGTSPVLSPYHHFTRNEWAGLRADTPLTLSIEDLTRLRSLNDPISLEEVVAIYLPLSRLLALYVAATQGLYKATQRFLGAEGGKVPYIIGVAGSVAAGKSTLSRVMQALLSRWPNTPKVELITTDGFLYPNARLKGEGLLEKKGFPESYDGAKLLCFLSDVKAGKHNVQAPVYSHVTYDVISGESIIIDRPDILIVEGLNVLLPNRPARDGRAIPFVSDFFDFSVYLHAAEKDLEKWFISRFMRLRDTSFRDPQSYFKKYAGLD